MNKYSKAGSAIALAIASVLMSSSAFAQSQTIDNWQNPTGLTWKNGSNELCWRDAVWTPATAAADCDGALKPEPAPAPAPAATPAPVPVPAPAPVAEKVTFAADAFFDFDKAVLKPAGKSSIDELLSKIKDINVEVIIGVGHTDSVGKDAYNQKLSVRRAEAVKAYIVSKGFEPNRVYAEGKGETKPVASNKTSSGRAKNRRVEIEVVGTRMAAPQQ